MICILMLEVFIVVFKGCGLGVVGSNLLYNYGDDSVVKRNNVGYVGVLNYFFENWMLCFIC